MVFANGNKEEKIKSYSFYALGTTCTASLYRGEERVFDEIEKITRDLESHLSINISESDISRINNKAGIAPVSVSMDAFMLISEGLKFSMLSKGLFDISIGPLVELWNISGGGNKVPENGDIKSALNRIDYKKVYLTKQTPDYSVFLGEKGMKLETGGIAKGFIADRVSNYLKEANYGSALINFGGNVVAIGVKKDGSNWRIAIQNPEASRGSYLGILSVRDESIVTSGKYERFFIGEDGLRYHHILCTETGFPVENGISQVSVICKSSTVADALSTSVFSMGIKEGLFLINSLPNTEAVIVTEEKSVILTKGIISKFELTANDFFIEN